MKFKEYNQEQPWLIPPDIEEEIPRGDICRVINDVFDRIDISHIEKQYGEEGNTAFHPRMMLKVLFYAYHNGIMSSRRIRRELEQNIYYWYLSGKQRPDFRTIANFRKKHSPDIEAIFLEIVKICHALGIADVGLVAVDGTKIKANANRDSFRDRKWIEKEIGKERETIRRLLEKAETIDKEEDEQFGNKHGDEIPEELHDREARLRKLEDLIDSLEKKKTKRISETDRDASLMRDKGRFIPAFNCQAVIDVNTGVILAGDVITTGNDSGQIRPLVEQMQNTLGQKPEILLADAGYSEGSDLRYLHEEGIKGLIPDKNIRDIARERERTLPPVKQFKKSQFRYDKRKDVYICPEGKELAPISTSPTIEKRLNNYAVGSVQYQCKECKTCKNRTLCCSGKRNRCIRRYEDEDIREKTNRLIRSDEGYELYKMRSKSIEPVFGHIKENLGFRAFSMRGLIKTRGEFLLLATLHNIGKITRLMGGNTGSVTV
ncbi:MAG: IS1182 family transposase [Spirochaetota bacterium]